MRNQEVSWKKTNELINQLRRVIIRRKNSALKGTRTLPLLMMHFDLACRLCICVSFSRSSFSAGGENWKHTVRR